MEHIPYIPENIAKTISAEVSQLTDDELMVLIVAKRHFGWEEVYFAKKEIEYRLSKSS